MDEVPIKSFSQTVEEWIASELKKMWQEELDKYTCVRCDVIALENGKAGRWCWMCGLHPKAEGPTRSQLNTNLRGLDI